MEPNLPQLGVAYLPVAFALGALHALEPGHGKTLASVYLVGGDRDWRDAVVLGLSTTLAHTGIVIVLAVGGFYAGDRLPVHGLEHGLSVAGALLLIAMGGFGLYRAARAGGHGQLHDHDHHHPHGHQHLPLDHGGAKAGHRTVGAVIAVGISNGLLPCPGAMTALIVALYLGRLAEGLAMVLVYSLGLAAALAGIGVLAIEAGRRAKAWLPSDKVLRWMPVVSAAVIIATGLLMLVAPSHHLR
jgi:ABC-type nickel/cobalt efflux system permease component RcnA